MTGIEVMWLCVGLVHLATATWLLVLKFPDRLHRAFALFCTLRGLFFLARSLGGHSVYLDAFYAMREYFAVAAPFALLYFIACYFERFSHFRRRRTAMWVLSAAASMYVLAAMWPLAQPQPARLAFWVGLSATWLDLFGQGLLAALLTRSALHQTGNTRRAQLTGAVGFAFFPTAAALHMGIPNLMPVGVTTQVVLFSAVAPIAWMAWMLIRSPPHDDARRALNFLALPVLSVLALVAVMLVAPDEVTRWSMLGMMSFWFVAQIALITYCILRLHLFAIDLGLKWVVHRGTLASFFVAAFIIISQVVEALSEATWGSSWLVAGLATGLLVFALTPLQRVADRLANAAMPDVAPVPAYVSFRKLQVYESTVAAVLMDGVSERERRMLDRMRARLGIDPKDARRIERDAGI
jgi:hypothetical protein